MSFATISNVVLRVDREKKFLQPLKIKFVAIFQMQTWRLTRIECKICGKSLKPFWRNHTAIPSSTAFTHTHTRSHTHKCFAITRPSIANANTHNIANTNMLHCRKLSGSGKSSSSSSIKREWWNQTGAQNEQRTSMCLCWSEHSKQIWSMCLCIYFWRNSKWTTRDQFFLNFDE